MLGPGAGEYLIDLWITAAQDRPSGVLEGWDDLDVADAADWPEDKDPAQLIDALIKCGWFKADDAGEVVRPYTLNDWTDHQGYVVGAPDRSNKARIAALIRHNGPELGVEKAIECGIDVTKYGYSANGVPVADKKDATGSAGSMPEACQGDAKRTAPTPNPDPIPSPDPKPKQTEPPAAVLPGNGSGSSDDGYFSPDLVEWREKIRGKCIELNRLASRNGKRFNAGEWVQQKVNNRGHPGAIDESLAALLKNWDTALDPWPYIDKIFLTVNGNWNERDACAEAEELKNMQPGVLKQFTAGMLKGI